MFAAQLKLLMMRLPHSTRTRKGTVRTCECDCDCGMSKFLTLECVGVVRREKVQMKIDMSSAWNGGEMIAQRNE